jgi:hypothetical protein
MARYAFTAHVSLFLVTGDTVNTKIKNSLYAHTLAQAQRDAPYYVADLINDFGSDDIDAPIDSFKVHCIHFDDEAWREDEPEDD